MSTHPCEILIQPENLASDWGARQSKPVIRLIAILCVALAANAAAAVTLAPLFRDGAVLQQGRPVPIWGTAQPGEGITVEFGGQKKAATSDAEGRWRVTLDPLMASAQPAELLVTGSSTIRVSNVLIGEVWICSGQSNMELPVVKAGNAEKEIAAASHPLIRQIKIPHTVSEAPAGTVEGEWETCSSETVGDFSAVGYFFGRTLFQELDTPIGLINASWGGTQIESWISNETLASRGEFSVVPERWKQRLSEFPKAMEIYEAKFGKYKEAKAAAAANGKTFTLKAPRKPEGAGSRWLPSGIYNAMVYPLIPYAIRGVIWYQGETNAARFDEYGLLFTTMISQWRKDFGQGDFPFLFVQLANLERERERKTDPSRRQWAFQREAQATALKLPSTGMAVTVDIGEADDIHPKNKQDVGRRLALIALASTYGKGGEYSGPIFQAATPQGAFLRLTFEHSDGLELTGASPVDFEVAGADKVFHPATAKVEGQSLLVSSPEVSAPLAVRYAWHNNPVVGLSNGSGLPAPPFRSDNWPSELSPGTGDE